MSSVRQPDDPGWRARPVAVQKRYIRRTRYVNVEFLDQHPLSSEELRSVQPQSSSAAEKELPIHGIDSITSDGDVDNSSDEQRVARLRRDRTRDNALGATNCVDNSLIQAVTHEDELELLLDRIQHVVGNENYSVEVRNEPVSTAEMFVEEQSTAERKRLDAPSYSDIAVFTRTRAFAHDLFEKANVYGIPIVYEGGMELFNTDQAKLLLAWLRICESNDRRGWATVLEEAGYALPHAREILDTKQYPDAMVVFRGS